MKTKLVLGIDEAGYGPNLGPLCIGGSLWRVEADCVVERMAANLSPVFQAKASDKSHSWIPLGDSKKLYKSGGALTSLSAGLLALESHRSSPSKLGGEKKLDLDRWLQPEDHARIQKIKWYHSTQSSRPDLFPTLNDVYQDITLESGKERLRNLKLELIAIRSRAIDEAEFNRLLDVHGNKSNLLSISTLEWIRRWLSELAEKGTKASDRSVEIFCDKHGGRNRYQGPLTHVFPESWFATDQESTSCSRYRGTIFGIETSWRFTAKGDSIVPSSVASMVAKWTREVLMDRLNGFWRDQVPGLRPTAGYPLDAKRFGNEIEGTAIQLGLDKSKWWRRV